MLRDGLVSQSADTFSTCGNMNGHFSYLIKSKWTAALSIIEQIIFINNHNNRCVLFLNRELEIEE